ncbi:MAG: 3-deoxy-7-phosphoheptulonate synthase [Gammaproteobacteria bacterium CG_4_10_14_0_8_um_filter_38_16]|nr:MAG: 3-deoxy-7-phosphoheptulonate synthase [Gammaproteobacteria bacterium CG_4_10_14_0_8_um_filter_38_16]PJA03048.1 MAG: 3-deoxy-7-phosphoheptulonate synthase [Gammaproteobacteria bacterium CG_4_10_14_0_2_um_filter_38_22]PJB10222.1 MAG: 3-deoxy-7-phosphoheptulonate synthase [Gammaproteobacteria bacterium CG_4_9_14_3_um_filter_38_9]
MSILITPEQLHQILPITQSCRTTATHTREQLKAILNGNNKRLVVIIGPCSIHDPQSAYEYAEKLQKKIHDYRDTLCIIMRTYFEKARTTVGWKGLIYDPDLNHSFAIEKGLQIARSLLLAINSLGVPTGTEILNPLTAPYFSDLISWAVIGARTTESQIHRELASHLTMPVGFKNNTQGDVRVAIDAIQAARQPHYFLSPNLSGKMAVMQSSGNAYGHVVLRGSQYQSNYDEATIQQTVTLLNDLNLIPRVMIDCSHGNSQKNHTKQPTVLQTLIQYIEAGDRRLFGVMLESHLIAGKQPWIPHQTLRYGQSITDACIGWEETEIALEQLHQAVQKYAKLKEIA